MFYHVLPRLRASFLSRSLKHHACHGTWSSCAKSKMTTASQNKTFEPFKTCPSSPNTTPATKKRRMSTTPANVLITCRQHEKVSDVLRMSHKTTFQTSKCPESLTPATKNGHRSKNDHRAQVKWREVSADTCARYSSKTEDRGTYML